LKFKYEDLISGDSIFVENVGHIRSPFLYELKPTQGIGTWTYNLYISLLAWDREKIINFLKMSTGRKLSKLEDNTKLEVFDILTIIEGSRELLRKAIAFFMLEDVVWNEEDRAFITMDGETNDYIGRVDRNNFEEVRDMMLQMNYINLGESAKPLKHSSDKARELWEKAQEYLKKESKKNTQEKEMNLGNIISKLAIASHSYNLLNIYNLTVFQLYDQFFQCGYLRGMELNERAYTIHGGEKFNMKDWLKPIINIKEGE